MTRRWLISGAVIALMAGVLAWFLYKPSSFDRDSPYEQRIFEGPSCRVRVSACAERVSGFALPGAGFYFESSETSDSPWRPVMEFRHDDPVPILDSSVRHVDENVVIVFMGWKCAISRDGGKSWNAWNAETDLPEWVDREGTNYQYIQELGMKKDGQGVMVLSPIRWTQLRSLETRDFGKTWVPTNPP
jgi:hypothetical protein